MDFRSGRPRERLERRRKDRQSDLVVIRWKGSDRTESAGHPLQRAHAEALLRAFEQLFRSAKYWLELPPAFDDWARREP
jgi:hypothetical protein